MKRCTTLLAVLVLSSAAFGQYAETPTGTDYSSLFPSDQTTRLAVKSELAGTPAYARQSSFAEILQTPDFDDGMPEPQTKKSPFLAGILSLAVPGLGDIYAENYWMAPVFMIAEAAGWYFNITENNRGDDATKSYRSYADQHWSVVKYAHWLNEHADEFAGGENAVQIDINPNEDLPPWERVNWEQMHQTESVVKVFSHKLPAYGEQQYYEVIGKYTQYSHGWDDKSDATGSSEYNTPSPRFKDYTGQRGKANDYYNTAETIVALVVVNHVLSAAHAAWSAARYNKSIDVQSHIEMRSDLRGGIEPVPTASLTLRF